MVLAGKVGGYKPVVKTVVVGVPRTMDVSIHYMFLIPLFKLLNKPRLFSSRQLDMVVQQTGFLNNRNHSGETNCRA